MTHDTRMAVLIAALGQLAGTESLLLRVENAGSGYSRVLQVGEIARKLPAIARQQRREMTSNPSIRTRISVAAAAPERLLTVGPMPALPALSLPAHLRLVLDHRFWLMIRLDDSALEALSPKGPEDVPLCQALIILARHICALGGGLPTGQHWQASFEIARNGRLHAVEAAPAVNGAETGAAEMSRLAVEVKAGALLHRTALIQALRSGIDPLVLLTAIADPRDCWGLRPHYTEAGMFYGVQAGNAGESAAALLLGAGMPRPAISGLTGLSAERLDDVLGDEAIRRLISQVTGRFVAALDSISAKDEVEKQAERLAGLLTSEEISLPPPSHPHPSRHAGHSSGDLDEAEPDLVSGRP